MAKVKYAFANALVDMAPGESVSCSWWHSDFDYGDALTITAHPVRSALAVQNLRIANERDHHVAKFDVANVGTEGEVGFGVGIVWVDA